MTIPGSAGKMSTLKLATTAAELAQIRRDATRAGHTSLAAYLRSLAGLKPRQVGGKREGAGRPFSKSREEKGAGE